MELVVLIPAVLCWAVLARWGARQALVWVWLPSVLLLPSYFQLRFPHLPPFHFADMAVLPLGAAVLATRWKRWRLGWMDLGIFLFAVSFALSEALSEQLANGSWTHLLSAQAATSEVLGYNISNGEFAFFKALCCFLMPYAVGKLAIEDEQAGWTRRAAIGCMAICLAVVAVLSVRDFIQGRSLWQDTFKVFFPGQEIVWPVQMRWGFGRIPGPYAHAILAGMLFMAGAVYWFWLVRVDPRWGRRRLMAGVPVEMRFVAIAAILAGLLMTQSRGPWGGLVMALLLVALLHKLPVMRAGLVFATIAAVLLLVVMGAGRSYTEGNFRQMNNQEQASAAYRRQLIAAYTPVVKERPVFGWGFTDHPSPNGQQSIDNEFLWLAVTQGFFGLGMFALIATGTGVRLLTLASRPRSREDQLLVYAHMAALLGLLAGLITVYMGEQLELMFFFLVGWIQGMQPAAAGQAYQPEQTPRYRFRKILI